MQSSTGVIVSHDTILRMGLQHLLRNFLDVNAETFQSVAELKDSGRNFDLYITDSETFALSLNAFLPKRQHLVIIANNEPSEDGDHTIINRYAGEEAIIAKLSHIIRQADMDTSSANELSQREIEVLCLIAQGHLNKEIADKLNISINTVLSHRKNITSKLGIKSVSGLSVYAMMNGYI